MKLKNIKPVLIIFILLIVGSFSLFAVAEESMTQGSATFKDSDKDGLSDDEELIYGTDPNKADTDNDGYSDGVEVESGYDPLKPAPGDKITSAEKTAVLGESTEDNVTSQLSEKLVEFIKENENKDGEVSVDDLDEIIQGAMGDELGEEALPEIDESSIKIKKQDYTSLSEEERAKRENEDAMNYLTSVLYIMISNAPTEINSGDDVNGFTDQIIGQASSLLDGAAGSMSFFDDLADRGQLIFDQMSEVEVPEKLVPTHKKGLQLAQQAIDLKGKINIDLNDPMGLVLNLSKVQKMVEQGASFYSEALLELKKYGIGDKADVTEGNADTDIDTIIPTISDFNVSNITQNGATIAWKTNEDATSQVEYGETISYGDMTTIDSTLKMEHEVTLTGLTADTPYHFRVLSADGAGNLVTGIDNVTITTVAPAL